jgi:RNA polymerase sigma factor (sigma-70 family)
MANHLSAQERNRLASLGKNGCEKSFGQLMESMKGKIINAQRTLWVNDNAIDKDDIFQDTCIEVFNSMKSFDPEAGRAEDWIMQIARRRVMRLMEKVNRRSVLTQIASDQIYRSDAQEFKEKENTDSITQSEKNPYLSDVLDMLIDKSDLTEEQAEMIALIRAGKPLGRSRFNTTARALRKLNETACEMVDDLIA